MKSVKMLYIGLIRSILDYGCIAYGSAAETQLKKLDVIQSTAMRVCLGAMKTSPISALQVEMGEMPLELRRKQIAVTYWINLQG